MGYELVLPEDSSRESWEVSQRFTAQDPGVGQFGDKCAYEETNGKLVVSGIRESDGVALAFIFERDEETGQLTKREELECSDSAPANLSWDDTAVAISGSTVALGAPH